MIGEKKKSQDYHSEAGAAKSSPAFFCFEAQPMADFLRMLGNISKRYGTTFDLTGRGIGIAAAYFKAVETGADGQPLSEPWKFAGVTEKLWSAARKESESKFVWRDDAMIVTGSLNKELKTFGVSVRKDAAVLTKDSCLDFEGIATSKSKDRDGDILEPMGCTFDPQQSLLLHHNPTLPVGRLVTVVEQNNEHVKNHWAMASTPLAMDSARLVEFGAFRLSIGFQPVDFKSIGEDSPGYNEDERNGWHVLKSYVMETSLVTVPANKDAIITQFSREKLTSDYLKKWAETFFDARPVVVKGGYNPITGALAPTNVNVTVNINDQKGAVPPAKKDEDPPKKPAKPDDDDSDADTASENPALKAIEESLKGIAGLKDLPQEATDRLATMTNMLNSVKESHSDAMNAVQEAAKSGDIAGIHDALEQHSSACVRGVAKLSNEMETIKGIDDLTDDHKSAIEEAHDGIKLVHDCFSGLASKEEDADGNEMDDEAKEDDDTEEKDGDDEETEEKDEDDEDAEEKDEDEDETKEEEDDETKDEDEEEEKDQTITSAPAYGEEIAADDDDVEEWEGEGKAANILATKLMGQLMLGKSLDVDTLTSLKDAVDEQLNKHLDNLLEEALA